MRSGSVARAEPWAAAAFALLYILGGVAPWWLLPLVLVAVSVGWLSTGLRWGLVAACAAVVAGAVLALSGAALVSDVLIGAARGLCAGVLPWLVVVAWRARRELESNVAATVVREHQVREQHLESQLAHERLRLAEQLHDDLGHALSLVALNLGRLELDHDLAAATRDAIGVARSQVGHAVEQLGASVQGLRDAAVPAQRTRVRVTGPPDVATLIADARHAGADVTVTGQEVLRGAAGPAAALAVSVVREGLTNALRHAPSQPVTVRVEPDGPWLTVIVSNPAVAVEGDGPHRTGGTGLRSLETRLQAVGGTLDAGARDGRFVLSTRFPRAIGETHDGSPTPIPRTSHGLMAGMDQARRRGTVLIGVAFAVPAVTLGMVATGLAMANSREAGRALLPSDQFAQISVGDVRADVARLLPEHALPRPDGAVPGCDYFALSVNPFADDFEDAYEICWDGDTVTSADLAEGAAR